MATPDISYNKKVDDTINSLPVKTPEELKVMGKTGTVIYSGQINDIDYVTELEDDRRFDIYDKMRLGDPLIGASLRALKYPIIQATDGFTPASEDDKDKEIAEFVEWNLTKALKRGTGGLRREWGALQTQALLFKDFGVMVFENIWDRNVIWNGKRMIGLTDISPRLPKTLYEWWLNTKNPEFDTYGIRQDLSGGGDDVEDTQPFIPLEVPLTPSQNLRKLVILTNREEGDNYQGYSDLRNIYGSWTFKSNLYKFDAMKHEKLSNGIIYARVPTSYSDADTAKVEKSLKGIRTNQELYAMFKANKDDIEFGFLDMKAGSTSNPLESAKIHNDDIATGLGTGFLMKREVGSQAKQKIDVNFFLMQENLDTQKWVSAVNNQIIPDLVNANFNVEDGHYPIYWKEKIRMDDMKEYTESLTKMIQNKVVTIGRELSNIGRGKLGLPEQTEEQYDEEQEELEKKKQENAKMFQKPDVKDDSKDKEDDKSYDKEPIEKEESLKKKELIKASERISTVKISKKEKIFQRWISKEEDYLQGVYNVVKLEKQETEDNIKEYLTRKYNSLPTEMINGVKVIKPNTRVPKEMNDKVDKEMAKLQEYLTGEVMDEIHTTSRNYANGTIQAIGGNMSAVEAMSDVSTFRKGYLSNIKAFIFNEGRRIKERIFDNLKQGVSITQILKQVESLLLNSNILKLSLITHPRGLFRKTIQDKAIRDGISNFKMMVPKSVLATLTPYGITLALLYFIKTSTQWNNMADDNNSNVIGGLGLHHNSQDYYLPISEEEMEAQLGISKDQRSQLTNN